MGPYPASTSRGSTYSSPLRTPQCRHARAAQWLPASSSVPTVSPFAIESPTATSGRSGSRVDRRPDACNITTIPRPATGPAKVTIPSAGERTGDPSGSHRSRPRCPGPHSDSGASNSAAISRREGASSHGSGARALAGTAAAAPTKAVATTSAPRVTSLTRPRCAPTGRAPSLPPQAVEEKRRAVAGGLG
jgi:hypothetical protein